MALVLLPTPSEEEVSHRLEKQGEGQEDDSYLEEPRRNDDGCRPDERPVRQNEEDEDDEQSDPPVTHTRFDESSEPLEGSIEDRSPVHKAPPMAWTPADLFLQTL